MFTRRDFLASGLLSTAAGLTVPAVLAKGVLAVHRRDGVVRIADRDLLGFLAVHREG